MKLKLHEIIRYKYKVIDKIVHVTYIILRINLTLIWENVSLNLNDKKFQTLEKLKIRNILGLRLVHFYIYRDTNCTCDFLPLLGTRTTTPHNSIFPSSFSFSFPLFSLCISWPVCLSLAALFFCFWSDCQLLFDREWALPYTPLCHLLFWIFHK